MTLFSRAASAEYSIRITQSYSFHKSVKASFFRFQLASPEYVKFPSFCETLLKVATGSRSEGSESKASLLQRMVHFMLPENFPHARRRMYITEIRYCCLKCFVIMLPLSDAFPLNGHIRRCQRFSSQRRKGDKRLPRCCPHRTLGKENIKRRGLLRRRF